MRSGPKGCDADETKRARVTIRSAPESVYVFHDGKFLGKTPVEADLPSGCVPLEVRSKGGGRGRTVKLRAVSGKHKQYMLKSKPG